MKDKKGVIVLIIGMVLLLVGAAALYTQLRNTVDAIAAGDPDHRTVGDGGGGFVSQ